MIKWGIAPIGWRNDDLPELGANNTISHVLSDIVVAGFDGTEVGGFFPDATTLKKELSLRKLEIAGQWFSSYILRDNFHEVDKQFRAHCRFLKDVHASIAVVSEQTYSIQQLPQNVFAEKPIFTEDEWQRLVTGLNHLGEIANEYGLKLAYHHHLGTGVQTFDEVRKLMNMTDPEKVHLLYDTGHIFVSDGEVMPLLEAFIDRIVHVHFKDVRADVLAAQSLAQSSFIDSFLAGLFTVPGDGTIDFTAPYRYLIEHAYSGWIVIEAEQDPSKAHPLEYALKARKYVDEALKKIVNHV